MGNRQRAKDLVQDMEDYNPQELKRMKKKGNIQKQMEEVLDRNDRTKKSLEETLISQIPKDLPPEEYQAEVNWRRQQAMELAQEEISAMYRN